MTDCYECPHAIVCSGIVKHFDPSWGLSPSCFAGKHADSGDRRCGGHWYGKWPSASSHYFRNAESHADDEWRDCVCDCHGRVLDSAWKQLEQKLRRLVGLT